MSPLTIMTEKSRCFIALELPKEIVSELVKVQSELKKENLFDGKYTEETNLHLTLKFLGSINTDMITNIRKKLKTIKMESFEAELANAGVFSETFVRIVWVILAGNGVFELQKKVDDLLKDKYVPEERFMSHTTIARVKSTKEKERLVKVVKNLKIEKIKSKITSFALMKSTLKPEGAVYEVIERFKLS
jgi:2'-5' RNA ligase